MRTYGNPKFRFDSEGKIVRGSPISGFWDCALVYGFLIALFVILTSIMTQRREGRWPWEPSECDKARAGEVSECRK